MTEKASTTISTIGACGMCVGDTFTMPVREDRWWVRAWYFLTFREAPDRRKSFKVTEVCGGTTLTTLDVETAKAFK